MMYGPIGRPQPFRLPVPPASLPRVCMTLACACACARPAVTPAMLACLPFGRASGAWRPLPLVILLPARLSLSLCRAPWVIILKVWVLVVMVMVMCSRARASTHIHRPAGPKSRGRERSGILCCSCGGGVGGAGSKKSAGCGSGSGRLRPLDDTRSRPSVVAVALARALIACCVV